MPDEETQIGGCLEGLAHLAGQAGDDLTPGGVGASLVRDERATEFQEDNIGVRNKRINGIGDERSLVSHARFGSHGDSDGLDVQAGAVEVGQQPELQAKCA